MKTLPFDAAKQQLESLLGTKLSTIDPDAIDAALGSLQWIPIPAGVENDDSMAQLLGFSSLPSDTEMVVVTDSSYVTSCGAFVVPASGFAQFQVSHLDQFSERVFSGCDVIIWAPEVKRLWIVHHEGIYAIARLGTARSFDQ